MGSFNPTKLGLVTRCLWHKIFGQPPGEHDIPTVDDAYFKSPDQLRPRARQGSNNEWYFYTTRPNCKFVTEDGFYSVFAVEDVLDNKNEHVGFMQVLTYYQRQPPEGKKTNWIIEEFSVRPAIIPDSQPGAKTLAKSFVICKLIQGEGDESSRDPTYTRKRKRMRAGRDKDEENTIKKKGKVAPPILENTVSGRPEYLAVNLKAVLHKCKSVILDIGNRTDVEIVALCKICLAPQIIKLNLFSHRMDLGSCGQCQGMYCVSIIGPGREFRQEDSDSGNAVPIMYLTCWNLRTFVFKMRETNWKVSLEGNRSVTVTLRDRHRVDFGSESLLGVNSYAYKYDDLDGFVIDQMRVVFTEFNGGLGERA